MKIILVRSRLRILWLISFILSLYGATILSLSTWRRYQETPTVISMERNWKEWNTSFPSITICPTVKYDEAALHDLLNTEYVYLKVVPACVRIGNLACIFVQQIAY